MENCMENENEFLTFTFLPADFFMQCDVFLLPENITFKDTRLIS